MAKNQSPPRCASCGSAIDLAELERLASRSKRLRSFDGDWSFAGDQSLIEDLLSRRWCDNPAFCELLCEDCRFLYSYFHGEPPIADPFLEENPW